MIEPYFQRDGITIYHGRAEDVLPRLVSGSVDIAITSPPYNMGLVPGGNGRGMYRPGASSKAGRFRDGYGEHSDALPQGEYDEWQRRVLAEMWRVVREAVYYNHRPRVEHGILRLPLGMEFGIPLRQIIVWDRGTGIDVNLRHYCTRQEWVLLFAKPTFRLIDHSASGCGDVWPLGMEHRENGHPAPFPLSLPQRILKTTAAWHVLDPFMGSGTTLKAAHELGRCATGIEIEERYCEIAARRLDQMVLPLEVA